MGLGIRMKKLLSFAFLLCLLPAALPAQTAGRGTSNRDDISGMYSFLHDGASVQLNLDHGNLSGWVTSFGFLDSDRDTLLARFFAKASLQRDHIYFLSKRIHGCCLEFAGRISREQGAL